MPRFSLRAQTLAGGFVAALGLSVSASPPAVAIENGHFVVDSSTGFAADGYDPVAYFVDRSPREGSGDYESNWNGVAWRFVNEGNRAAFDEDPLVYAPKFGGHCPIALARGYPAEGDPRLWAIFGDRLYFFFSQANLLDFTKDPEAVLAKAEASWDRLFPY